LQGNGKSNGSISGRERRPDEVNTGDLLAYAQPGIQKLKRKAGEAPTPPANAQHRSWEGRKEESSLERGRPMKRPNGFVYKRKGSPYLWIAYRIGRNLKRESSGKLERHEAEELLRQRQQMIQDGTISRLDTRIEDLIELV